MTNKNAETSLRRCGFHDAVKYRDGAPAALLINSSPKQGGEAQ
jgi:hypothetical protein